MIFYSPYIYGEMSLQNSGMKVVFLGGNSIAPPWAPTGVKIPWSLSVKAAFESDSCVYDPGFRVQEMIRQQYEILALDFILT